MTEKELTIGIYSHLVLNRAERKEGWKKKKIKESFFYKSKLFQKCKP